ncbi:MAG: serine/threonine-protein phosphatase [Chloroflexi bacterium]|nr:serine/threonine-protein phosphatase [Chloroflexota bacterium]
MDWLRRFLGLQPAESPVSESEDKAAPSTSPTAAAPAATPETDSSTDDTQPNRNATAQLNEDGRTRQLPPLETVTDTSSTGTRLNYGLHSDVGQVRDNNQDAMLSFTACMSGAGDDVSFGFFIVADGMGGHEDGEKASALATQIVARHVTNDIFLSLLRGETGGDSERPTIIEVLRNAVQKANEIVSTQVPDGGTTVTASAIMGHSAYIAHVGDSRAYLIARDSIEHVTRDHSLVQRLIELDQLTPEDAADHPQKNVLYRAIGQSDNIDVDAIIRQIPPEGYLMLCSDGLWNMLSNEEIHQTILKQYDNPQSAAQKLVALANERGGPDNITVILVQIPV